MSEEHYSRKVLLRAALFTLASMDDSVNLDVLQRVCETGDSSSDKFLFEPEGTTKALAQWGLDRVRCRLLADRLSTLSRDPDVDVLADEQVRTWANAIAHQQMEEDSRRRRRCAG